MLGYEGVAQVALGKLAVDRQSEPVQARLTPATPVSSLRRYRKVQPGLVERQVDEEERAIH